MTQYPTNTTQTGLNHGESGSDKNTVWKKDCVYILLILNTKNYIENL